MSQSAQEYKNSRLTMMQTSSTDEKTEHSRSQLFNEVKREESEDDQVSMFWGLLYRTFLQLRDTKKVVKLIITLNTLWCLKRVMCLSFRTFLFFSINTLTTSMHILERD